MRLELGLFKGLRVVGDACQRSSPIRSWSPIVHPFSMIYDLCEDQPLHAATKRPTNKQTIDGKSLHSL